MLVLKLTRFKEKQDNLIEQGCTISRAVLLNGEEELYRCYMLEPAGPDCTTPNQDRRIPEGTYNVEWAPSTMSGHKIKGKLPLIYNEQVSKDRKIRMHGGNRGEDSLGCLLPGTAVSGWAVAHSIAALTKILDFTFEKDLQIVIENKIEVSA